MRHKATDTPHLTVPSLFALLAIAAVTSLAIVVPMAAQTPTATTAPVIVEEPRDIVAALYKLAVVEAKKTNATSPYFDPKARQKYFSQEFDVLVTQAQTKAAHDDAAGLSFDPISASPDAEIQKVTLKTDVLELTKAVVSASFLNRKQPTVVTYDFVRENGAWKINDIKGTTEKEAWSVRKILKVGAKEPSTLPGMPNAQAAPDAPRPPVKPEPAK